MRTHALLGAGALALLTASPRPAAAQTPPGPPTVSSPKMSLRDALALAAAQSVSLKQARADADAARASARAAQAQTRPSLSATIYGTTGDSPNILTSSPGVMPQNVFAVAARPFADQDLMLMVPLLSGGRLGRSAAAAQSQEEAAALSVRASRLSVAEAVTEDYTQASLQQALVGVAQARLSAEDEQVRVTGEKVDAGRSAPVDLLREQAEQADARQGLLAAQTGVALALVTLRSTLGISQESDIALSDTLDGLAASGDAPPATVRDALGRAEARRPELASARKQVEAAQANVGAARAASAPQVYGVAMADASTGQGAGRLGYTVGITASLPLLDGGERRADEDGARARLDRARADALAARQAIDGQAASAWLTLQTAAAQVPTARTGVAAAQEAFTLAGLRYEAGKSVAAERLDALSALSRARGTLAQAQANLVIARARLRAAMGG